MSFKQVGSEMLTNFNNILEVKDGGYHWNLSSKFYAWSIKLVWSENQNLKLL